jgi:hypothetical protein
MLTGEIVVQLLDRNWQLGRYDVKIKRLDLGLCWNNSKHDEDYVVNHWKDYGFTIMDRRTMEINQVNHSVASSTLAPAVAVARTMYIMGAIF